MNCQRTLLQNIFTIFTIFFTEEKKKKITTEKNENEDDDIDDEDDDDDEDITEEEEAKQEDGKLDQKSAERIFKALSSKILPQLHKFFTKKV